MNNFWTDIKYKLFNSGSKLGLLIGINVFVFLLINIPSVLEQLFVTGLGAQGIIKSYAFEYLAMPASLPKLLARFWTPVTYMFMHDGIFHILFYMLWLYWLGQLFEEYLGQKKTIFLYLAGGLSGALFYLAGFNLIPAFAHSPEALAMPIVGASAAVMAIVISTATLLPDYELYLMFIGPVKLKWIAIFYVVIDFLGIAGPNAGGELAHLGGALFGFIYMKQLQRGNNLGAILSGAFAPKPKIKVVSNNSGYQRSRKTVHIAPDQDEIDRILDKISQSGYESLTKTEKETLFRASKND
ncbi:rhomboid family protein [Mucilaginibacter ginkgonis]|uniref:Rhomboid family intramembrane serine protease n=1 Tax=Mucilaginibacter ginkgonis TaxID=2682091 RepID=A0A6I4HY73_9SPHI|nr:rhomboid family intramembrane serine protease [Mucilaginibacter ginkgonis]QQL49446.1 rhomboid family intramembrane serine protease [Mucilaginibacter ginkgonis]